MGIRFACHVCAKKLNVKTDLAGKRGVCPACSTRFRIPLKDTDKSTALDDHATISVADGQAVQPNSFQANDAPLLVGHLPGEPLPVEPLPEEPLPGDPVSQKPAPSHQLVANRSENVPPEQEDLSLGAGEPNAGVPSDPLSEDPDVSWYVRPPSGGQYGPATGDILRAWISEGRVAASALLWREGWPQWRVASDAFPSLKLADTSYGSVSLNQPTGGTDSSSAMTESNRQTGKRGQAGSVRSVQQLDASEHTANSTTENDSATEHSGAETIEPVFSGRSDVGAARRKRSGKRIFWIGVLSAAVLVLTAAIIYLMMVSG